MTSRPPAVWLLAAVFLAGCATTVRLTNGPMVPAAQGEVTVTEGENGNTKLALKVQHLALPEKVDAAATVYVVWVMANLEGSAPQNVGALVVDQALTGTLETITPLKQFELTITPEPTATVTAPSGPKVFSASIVAK
jgi:hypothetical protein